MFSTLLIPLDGSAVAEAALGFAALLPSQRVRLLHVEPVLDALWLADYPELLRWQAERETAARDYLHRAGETLRQQGREVDVIAVQGDPAAEISARSGAADLIVMTTTGRGAAGRALFGSVADRVARHATTPTLLIRTDGLPASPPRVTRVVVPLDGSPLAALALPAATGVARLLAVPIHLVRVLDSDVVRGIVQAGVAAGAADARSQEAVRQQAMADLDEVARALRAQGLSATTALAIGNPAAELLDAIRPDDLVAMTTHGRGGIRRWLLGSVADKLIREAAAPVLLVHPPSPG